MLDKWIVLELWRGERTNIYVGYVLMLKYYLSFNFNELSQQSPLLTPIKLTFKEGN